MKRFYVVRKKDVTGVSGTGYVAEGCKFTDGSVVVRWRVANKPSSLEIHSSLSGFLEIHGHGGLTKIKWIDAYDESD